MTEAERSTILKRVNQLRMKWCFLQDGNRTRRALRYYGKKC